MTMLDPDLLKILACPACDERPGLSLDKANSRLSCSQCGRKYPIRDGIPVLLIDEAVQ